MPQEKENEPKASVQVKEDFNFLLIKIAAALTWEEMGNFPLALQEITYAEFLAQTFKNEAKMKECQEIKERLLKKSGK